MDEARERLAQAMDQRRLVLRIKWAEVARRARMDPSNLRRIRNGGIPVTPDAAYGIEEALEWPHGHVAWLLTDSVDPARAALLRAHEVYVEQYGLEKADEMIARDVQEINEARGRGTHPADESDAG